MQAQPATRRSNVVAHARGLVRRQTVEHEMHRLAPAPHELAQQGDKQSGFERAAIGAKPERPVGVDRRGGTERLTLSGSVHDRRLAAHAPGLTVHRISTEARLIPEKHLATVLFRLTGDGWEGFTLPAFNRLGVPLIGSLQRLLRRQSQFRQQLPDRRDAYRHPELLRHQLHDHRARPQAEVQSILSRVTTIDPAEHLSLLRRAQGSWPPRSLRRTQRLDADTRLQRRFDPFVDGRPVEPERCDHRRRRLAFANALYRQVHCPRGRSAVA